jgi:hypothetical protein
MKMCRLKGKDLKEEVFSFEEIRCFSFQDCGQYLVKKIRECNGDNSVRNMSIKGKSIEFLFD